MSAVACTRCILVEAHTECRHREAHGVRLEGMSGHIPEIGQAQCSSTVDNSSTGSRTRRRALSVSQCAYCMFGDLGDMLKSLMLERILVELTLEWGLHRRVRRLRLFALWEAPGPDCCG